MLNHEQKLKLARRLRNDEEARKRTPIFQTKAWDKYKEANKNKGKRKTSSIGYRVEVPQIKISWFRRIINKIKKWFNEKGTFKN